MLEVDYNLESILKWCSENEVVFKVTQDDTGLCIKAAYKNIFSEYTIEPPFDATAVGNATWAALCAVKHGAGFHVKHGHFPPLSKKM